MCKLVAELVGADKQLVREIFHRLELQSGNPSLDVRLTSEVYGRLYMKMRELGLDSQDTTPQELYQALIGLAAQHDAFLAERLGINGGADWEEVAQAVIRLVSRMRMPKQVWALKTASARNLLKKRPPKSLMKALHYRSIDSMLKRETPLILLAVGRHSESVQWQKQLLDEYRKLKASDFEIRHVEVEFLAGKHWHALAGLLKNRHNSIISSPETGVVGLLPFDIPARRGLTLTTLLITFHYISDIRVFSSYGKFIHMRPDFGKLFVSYIQKKQPPIFIAGQEVDWRVIHRYFGDSNQLKHPEIFTPHVQPEDLAYRKAEAFLFRLEPALHFWHDLDYVGLPQPDGPISFNLVDICLELLNDLPYEKRIYRHLQTAVWDEIYIRYMSQKNFERQILLQLEEHSVAEALRLDNLELAWQ